VGQQRGQLRDGKITGTCAFRNKPKHTETEEGKLFVGGFATGREMERGGVDKI